MATKLSFLLGSPLNLLSLLKLIDLVLQLLIVRRLSFVVENAQVCEQVALVAGIEHELLVMEHVY